MTTDVTFSEKYGPWALVAGASEGLGGAWADHAAAEGLSVVLVARDPAKLEAKEKEIRSRFDVDVLTVSQDLAQLDAMERIVEQVGDREIGFLVYNAGLASVGSFFDSTLEVERQRLNTNCGSALALTFHYGAQMKQRRRGGIVIMSSGSGLLGSPFYTHYGATKAYDIALAEGLWFELKGHDVDVLSCIAGLTSTPKTMEGFATARERGEFIQTPEEVVAEAVAHLGVGPSIITGEPNRQQMEIVTRQLPRAQGVAALGQHALDNFLGGQLP